MHYEMMLPREIRTAIAGNWPVVLPLGVLEYHGEHMAVGMDTLAVVKTLDIIEHEMNLIILPPFYYGASSYVVEPPEGNGSLHVGAQALLPFAQELFMGLLRIGFRNIHFFIHHQTENFTVGMPTDLAFKLAARQAIFAFLEKERGEGWWGNAEMADYYEQQKGGDYPFNHAGMGETSLMLSLCPESVDMDRLSTKTWYTRNAAQSTAELGTRGR